MSESPVPPYGQIEQRGGDKPEDYIPVYLPFTEDSEDEGDDQS